jgi:hypothetical protein
MEYMDAINILKDIVKNGFKHKHYDRTVKKAKEYKTIITGEGIEEYLRKFPRRETDEELKQRLELTVNVTETVCGNLIDPQEKVSRSNSIERTFLYIDNNKAKKDELERILNSFYDGGKSVDDYMADMWIKLNALDPNTFVVIDWKENSNGERIKPYPVEYPAESVYHYSKTNNSLNWVVVHRDETSFDPEMYILYSPNFTVLFTRKLDNLGWTHEADIEFYKEFPLTSFQGTTAVVRDKMDVYWDVMIPPPHNLGEVPGFFVGYVLDLYTKQTYLSSIHKAMPILKKIIKANSELDLTMALHAFPQKVQYTAPCNHCSGGKTIEGTVCSECNGTGLDTKEIHSTAMDIMKVPRPRDKEDMFPLAEMIHYVPNDVRLLKFQDEYIDKLTRKCKEAVYNSEVFSRKDVAETAYGKNVDLQNVYDALWSMAKSYAYIQNFIVKTIAKITALDDGLIYKITFRKDFKMKSLTDLYNDLAIVGTSNSDEFVKKAIEDDIAQVLYEDDQRQLLKYNTQNYFFPFNGKTKKEIEVIVTNPSMTSEKIRILWSNFSWLFDEIEMEFAEKSIDFYQMPRLEQKKALDAKVEEILKTIEKPEIYVGEDLLGTQTQAGRPTAETPEAR